MMERNQPDELSLEHILKELDQCADLNHRSFPELAADIVYFPHSVDNTLFIQEVLEPFSRIQLPEMDRMLRQSQFVRMSDPKTAVIGILEGNVAIFHRGKVYLLNVSGPEVRNVQSSETETVISGPHDAFVESAFTNLSLIRRRLKSPHLKIRKYAVGEISKTAVYVLYIQDIANMKMVEELERRIQRIETDALNDGGKLTQFIEDMPNSVFPQFLTTERPDVAVSKLTAGRIIMMIDNSPTALSAPASFFEFFSSPDDYYQRWALGTALRLLRFIALLITITFTAMYVSVTTFHYEMIPEALLRTLAESRNRVPFPPVYEALLMEIMIELLREAGARLPSKIGQTIGIVGGIVIGQAAVQAGLTSNVLIIAVASSAIASFVIPSYMMSASIRLIRFGVIILAGIWGNMGLVIGMALIVIHLSGLTSMGTSYITPVAPMKPGDWKDVFIRAPFSMLRSRPTQTLTNNKIRQKNRE
ncbi:MULTISPECIES: spore germination protein [unclassified Paenibacillus]|uniref:spore germination protein n=1 Tax=unclassified Paenibacillus TaxID=185978 RepID=UPI0024076336|nr:MULTISPECIES: spore germination protein [unclassified Paenibacillus]MDF9844138.1 spore germination protein [Paenibacillus sp. PastF-2]MDF9850740.1 spore germination protein [Paenibacillus sp. PastM-2]MDF9857310.1 spore germination protein [Paenibacillus sp. PastF-1]MDH6482582.1 spore germination protein [Paenibacillus sp. PastH-2]MDH6510009.1 spore germination protein [Paenibacillus sp. PastM-3]